MPITFTAEQEAWLRAHVASGAFASIEEAARQVIDERIAEDRRRKAERQREVPLGQQAIPIGQHPIDTGATPY